MRPLSLRIACFSDIGNRLQFAGSWPKSLSGLSLLRPGRVSCVVRGSPRKKHPISDSNNHVLIASITQKLIKPRLELASRSKCVFLSLQYPKLRTLSTLRHITPANSVFTGAADQMRSAISLLPQADGSDIEKQNSPHRIALRDSRMIRPTAKANCH
jgi:hypothetical protein